MKRWSQYLQAMIVASMLTTYHKQMESYILMKLFLFLIMIHMFEISHDKFIKLSSSLKLHNWNSPTWFLLKVNNNQLKNFYHN
jgi:hypothetical protein